MPIYIYKGVFDEVSVIADSDTLVDTYCQGGAIVQYDRMFGAGHLLGELTGYPAALAWLSGILDGRRAPRSRCQIRNRIFSLFSPDLLENLPRSAILEYIDKLGKAALAGA